MAWHVRQALGDVLWRSEAGLPLPDYRSPGAWVDDIAARLRELSIEHRVIHPGVKASFPERAVPPPDDDRRTSRSARSAQRGEGGPAPP